MSVFLALIRIFARRSCGGAEKLAILFDNDWGGDVKQIERSIHKRLLAHWPKLQEMLPTPVAGKETSKASSITAESESVEDDFDDANFSLNDLDGGESGVNSQKPNEKKDSRLQRLLQDCLDRVLIARCRNSFEFLVTLGTLFQNPQVRDSDGIAMVSQLSTGRMEKVYALIAS